MFVQDFSARPQRQMQDQRDSFIKAWPTRDSGRFGEAWRQRYPLHFDDPARMPGQS
jgi:hypothetical protein